MFLSSLFLLSLLEDGGEEVVVEEMVWEEGRCVCGCGRGGRGGL